MPQQSCYMKLIDKEAKTEELLEQYKDLVKAKAGLYFMLGGDKEDIVQEGMIGLYKAIQSYDESKGTSFKTFADLCINRQIITAIKSANRKKAQVLNNAVSLDKPVGDDEDSVSLGESLTAGTDTDPETIAVLNEMTELLLAPEAKVLSKSEREVLELLIQGEDYQSIAKIIGKTPKQIDNTIQRIRVKLKKFFI